MKIAHSIRATSRNGREIDLKTNAIITAIMMIDTQLTTLKSWFAISTRSFVQGASPISIPFASYFLTIFFS